MNIPIDNTALEEAAEKIKEGITLEKRLWFLHKLIGAKFILPVLIVPEPVDNKIAADSTVSYFSMKTSKDLVYLVVFTNGDEYEKWNKNPNKLYLIRSYDDVKNIVLNSKGFDGFVINPCGCNIAIQNSLILNIEKASNPEVIMKPEKVLTEGNMGLRPVEKPPEKLAAALREYFEKRDNISAVYYMETIRKGDDKPTPVLVVEFCKDGSLKAAFDGIASVAHNVMKQGETIGLMPSFDKVAQNYIKGVTPFYRK
ncbi:MAG: enhanced serine sensitivity protein SseB C-terminal domain-containing protein [Clostridia bacterium]|nr:enhanced serine sensitivity protein SseB C-terminal domain-containing protein [Clostridia bacterium]